MGDIVELRRFTPVQIATGGDFVRAVESLSLPPDEFPGHFSGKARIKPGELDGLPQEIKEALASTSRLNIFINRDANFNACNILIGSLKPKFPLFRVEVSTGSLEAKFWEPLDATLAWKYDISQIDGRLRTQQLATALVELARKKLKG